MKVTHYRGLEWLTRPDFGADDGRGAADKTQYKPLQRGEPGLPGHFEMVVTRYPAPKSVPRHRHSHDQLRYTLAGTSPWAPGQSTPTGSLLYIPSGTAYGPYERPTDIELLSIEFEGANAAPFVDIDMLYAAHQRLAARGEFDGNVYHWVDEDAESQKMNSRRARELEALGFVPEAPHPRFTSPLEIHPHHFGTTAAGAGTSHCHMLTFEESGTAISMLSLDGGADHRHRTDGTELLFVTTGAGIVDGSALSERDALQLHDETVVFEAESRLELLILRLPKAPAGETTEEATHARQPAA